MDLKQGLDNVAFATSKDKNRWKVSLFWYDTIESKNCPDDSIKKAAKINMYECMNKFNFYSRRLHDYDLLKG